MTSETTCLLSTASFTLLYRNEHGVLLGILNHYPVDYPPWERAGNVNIWVREDHRREGIATRLLGEAMHKWEINLDQQRFTQSGVDFANAFVQEESKHE